MARRLSLPFRDVQLKVVGPKGAFIASRVQKLDVQTNFPSTDIDELGNNEHAGVVTDSPELTLTFQAMDTSVNIFAFLTGSFPYPSTGVSITQLKDIDVVGQVRDADVSDMVKSFHGKKLRINGFNFSYSATGEATEEYTAIGSEKRWFRNDVIVDKNTTPGTSVTLTQTPITLKNGNKVLSVIVDGVYFTEVAAGPSTNEFSVSGTTVTLGTALVTQAIVVYHASPAGNNYDYLRDTSIPAAVRGKNIPVMIGVNNISRVQSVTMRGEFPNSPVKEMGNVSIVGYSTQVPKVTGDISILDTDLDMVSLFSTGVLSSQTGETEFADSAFTASGLALTIKILSPVDNTTVLKTLYVPQIVITSEGHSTSVGGDATQTFGWKSGTGNLFIYSGAKI